MKKNFNRVLSFVLVFMMVLSLAPVSAFAETVDEEYVEEVAPIDQTPAQEVEQEEETSDEEIIPEATQVPEATQEPEPTQEPTPEPAEEPTPEATEEPTPKATEEPEEVEEELNGNYPMQAFNYRTSDGTEIFVDAPEGAFPEGTRMEVKKVELDKVQKLVDADEDVAGKVVAAVDISFYCGEEKVQPRKDVRVSYTSAAAAEVENPQIIHIDAVDAVDVIGGVTAEAAAPMRGQMRAMSGAGASAANNSTERVKLTFGASSFSVYAIIGNGETGDNARLFVTFKQANGAADIVIPVKKTDLGVNYEIVLYDPGVGTLTGRQTFMGWIDKEDYTVADKDNALTIDEVRAAVQTKLNNGVKEGDTVTYYPMLLDVYNVTFLDEKGAGIKTDPVLLKSGSSESYTINEDYEPLETDSRFEGWGVASQNADGKWVLPDTDNYVADYQNGDTVMFGTGTGALTDDLVLRAFVPSGYWLIFKENGQGASFTPAAFYRGAPTQQPTPAPTRFGYIFGGWYTDAACTTAFTFGGVLTETTRVYAKWNPIERAPYTVIIWTENITCDGYDFKEVVTVEDAVVGNNTAVGGNANATTVTIPGGNNKSYTGFHLKAAPTNVVVKPEGTSVVNVYFDRTEYTFTFQANANHQFGQAVGGVRTSSNPLTTIYTVTRKFDLDISDIWNFRGSDGYNYPETNANTSWQPHGSSEYTARITSIQRMPAENITFVLVHTDNTTRYFHYYIEVPEGESGTRSFQGRQYNLYQDLPNDFNYVYYNDDFWNLKGFARQAIAKSNDDVVAIDADQAMGWDSSRNNVGTGNRTINGSYGGTNNHLYFYYTRLQYPINYMDGKYVDGNGVEITEGVSDRGQLHESEMIDFDASIASYGKGGADYYAAEDKIPQGFAFGGWFIDKSCTQPYTFDKMPLDGVTVYAKWVLIQYRVFLYPNATGDASFQSGEQSTSFRIDYNEELALNQMLRDEYEFNGWFTDPSLSAASAFSPASFVANNDTVTTEYDRSEPTEKDFFGVATANYNNDDAAHADRFWITHKLELYAKWRLKLIGSDGIVVIYESGEDGQFSDGSKTFEDPLRYQDDADAVAQGASKSTTEGKEFKRWVLQMWNGSEFVPTETKVLPGDIFKVLASQAQILDNETGEPVPQGTKLDPDGSYTYTIKLVAEYGDIEAPTPTHINWYSNVQDIAGIAIDPDGCTHVSDAVNTNEDYATRGWVIVRKPISINIGYNIEPADTYAYKGYTFIGWAKKADATESELFLKYVDGKFYAQKVEGQGEWDMEVTQVAADENQPYDDLYAIWKGEFRVYHSGVAGGAIETFQITEKTFDLTATNLTENTLYGGYYLKGGFTAPDQNEEGVPTATCAAYDGDNWTWTAAQTTSGKEITPIGGTTYYIKEVPTGYLGVYTHYTYNKSSKVIGDMWFISAVDDLMYKETGFLVATDKNKAEKVVSSLTVTNATGGKQVTLTPTSVFKTKVAGVTDYLSYWTASSLVKADNTVTFVPYWVTIDGVEVYGITMRKIAFNNGKIGSGGMKVSNESYPSSTVEP